MSLLTNTNSLALWQEVIHRAEDSCAIMLKKELEAYLASLLMRYTSHTDLLKHAMAIKFLKSLQAHQYERHAALQNVGDECLLVTGLFPNAVDKYHVKIHYFVDLGQAAYANISQQSNDIFQLLANHFVLLMDSLQSIRQYSKEYPDLMPLAAYEQWSSIGSQRARRVLEQYTGKNTILIKI